MADLSNQFNTPIPTQKTGAYRDWIRRQIANTGKDPSKDSEDYDVQGYYLSGQGTDPRGHGPDTFKKPNHPTFSDESQYSNLSDQRGGTWGSTGTGKNYFLSMPSNLKYRSLDDLKQYFNRYEPGVTLEPPPKGTEAGLPGPAPVPLPAGLQRVSRRYYGEKQ